MRRLNVLYLIRTWALGGSHTIMFLLLKHLPQDLFNITCVAYDTVSNSDDVFVRAAESRGCTVAPERIPWRSRGNWSKARAALDSLIAQYDADLVHTHDPQSNVLVGIGRKRWSCACVASAYGWWRRLFPLRSHLYNWAERCIALPQFDDVITVSQDMKRQVLSGGTRPERVHVVNTGLEPTTFFSTLSRQEARARLGVPQDACVVGTVSRVYVEKGHRYLIDALSLIKQPPVHLLIVGDGPARTELEEQAARLGVRERVTFTGYCDDLPAAFRAMDIFAQPSILAEGFPTSVLEAQLAGLPVVATNVGGTSETLRHGETGLLTLPRRPGALAEAITTLAESAARREEMGERGRVWVRETFTLDAMISNVSEVYRHACERRL